MKKNIYEGCFCATERAPGTRGRKIRNSKPVFSPAPVVPRTRFRRDSISRTWAVFDDDSKLSSRDIDIAAGIKFVCPRTISRPSIIFPLGIRGDGERTVSPSEREIAYVGRENLARSTIRRFRKQQAIPVTIVAPRRETFPLSSFARRCRTL